MAVHGPRGQAGRSAAQHYGEDEALLLWRRSHSGFTLWNPTPSVQAARVRACVCVRLCGRRRQRAATPQSQPDAPPVVHALEYAAALRHLGVHLGRRGAHALDVRALCRQRCQDVGASGLRGMRRARRLLQPFARSGQPLVALQQRGALRSAGRQRRGRGRRRCALQRCCRATLRRHRSARVRDAPRNGLHRCRRWSRPGRGTHAAQKAVGVCGAKSQRRCASACGSKRRACERCFSGGQLRLAPWPGAGRRRRTQPAETRG